MSLLRRALRRLRPPVSRAELMSAQYKKDMTAVMRRVLKEDSNCVEVGAHAGRVLGQMVALAPQGRHTAIEPLPHLAAQLTGATVHVCAVGAYDGESTFVHVVSNPTYSGLKERPYDRPDEVLEELTVAVRRLDDLGVPRPVRFLEVDVEGGEVDVLIGAQQVLREDRPYVAFEFGAPSARAYGHTADDVYDVLTGAGLLVTTMARWLAGEPALDREAWHAQTRLDYFFLATPPEPVAPLP